jgi:hypothetical protein
MKTSVSIMEFKRIGTDSKCSVLVVIHLCVVPMCLALPAKGIKNESPNIANNSTPKNVVMNLF